MNTNNPNEEITVQVPLRKATVEDFYYVERGEKKWNINMQYFVLNSENKLESCYLRPPMDAYKRQSIKLILQDERAYVFRPSTLENLDHLIKIVKN